MVSYSFDCRNMSSRGVIDLTWPSWLSEIIDDSG